MPDKSEVVKAVLEALDGWVDLSGIREGDGDVKQKVIDDLEQAVAKLERPHA